jgi:recombination protein RecA
MGDSKMGLHARLMSQALEKTGTISKTNCTVNQLREKLGNVWESETTTGGNALKFTLRYV